MVSLHTRLPSCDQLFPVRRGGSLCSRGSHSEVGGGWHPGSWRPTALASSALVREGAMASRLRCHRGPGLSPFRGSLVPCWESPDEPQCCPGRITVQELRMEFLGRAFCCLPHPQPPVPLRQPSPTFLAPRTSFVEDSLPMVSGWGMVWVSPTTQLLLGCPVPDRPWAGTQGLGTHYPILQMWITDSLSYQVVGPGFEPKEAVSWACDSTLCLPPGPGLVELAER